MKSTLVEFVVIKLGHEAFLYHHMKSILKNIFLHCLKPLNVILSFVLETSSLKQLILMNQKF